MIKNSNSQLSTNPGPRLAFILGIDKRSGTNYLFRLLREHPHCSGPGPVWEDWFVENSRFLKHFGERVCRRWAPEWGVPESVGGEPRIMRGFGDALRDFLLLQLPDRDSSQVLLAKTPSIEGLEHFFELFPDAHLIILVRDGRALVESGVRSFGWKYEGATRRWRERARKILKFIDENRSSDRSILLLRYEDLVTDQASESTKVFRFLGVNPDLFDFNMAKTLSVTGTCETKSAEGRLDWRPQERRLDFNPLARARDWGWKQHERFNWLAGEEMKKLGYDLRLPICGRFGSIRNSYRDIAFTASRNAVRLKRRVSRLLSK